VRAHPGVARLDAGPFGTVASLLPGRRVAGVRIGAGDEPVELAVVARYGTPLPRLAAELGGVVRGMLGPVGVDVTFSDVVFSDFSDVGAPEPTEVAGRRPPGPVT
jgi:hypothetical protein